MSNCPEFWDALAPLHSEVEDTNFDLASVRRLLPEIQSPVLVVGAGQGLIVEEVRRHGHACDGLDLSAEMIRHAKLRRGITLVRGDAKALPFPAGSYATAVYATGVVDFTAEEEEIRCMLSEARRVVGESGKVYVAFYKASAVQEAFLQRVGLVRGHQLAFRESLGVHLLNPAGTVAWVAGKAGLTRFRAAMALLRVGALCTRQERKAILTMQRMFRRMNDPRALIDASPETLPYRNAGEIGRLFERLGVGIRQWNAMQSCWVVQI